MRKKILNRVLLAAFCLSTSAGLLSFVSSGESAGVAECLQIHVEDKDKVEVKGKKCYVDKTGEDTYEGETVKCEDPIFYADGCKKVTCDKKDSGCYTN